MSGFLTITEKLDFSGQVNAPRLSFWLKHSTNRKTFFTQASFSTRAGYRRLKENRQVHVSTVVKIRAVSLMTGLSVAGQNLCRGRMTELKDRLNV